jgi:hypothetical protein
MSFFPGPRVLRLPSFPTRDALPRGIRRFTADVAGSVLPRSPRHRRSSTVTLSRRRRRSFMTAATPRPGFHCPVPDSRRRRSERYLSPRAMLAPAPFTVRHLTVLSKARPARPPCPPSRRRGAAQEIWASQSAWVAERAMTPVLSTDVCFPRFVLQRTGTPVCLGSLRAVFPPAREPSVSRQGARFGEPAAVPKPIELRSACAGVPLTLRRRAPHRAEASTEVKPPPWRGERASTEQMSIESARQSPK